MDLEAHRDELVAYCYRMLGSHHDAEDVVQEVMLRAWRARERYDPQRASVRTWLFRIATNACLTALRSRSRRELPSQVVPRSDDPQAVLTPDHAVSWLEPLPDAAHALERRTGLRLALIAALQRLPARTRAVLVLREVLQFSAAEVADLLDTTVPAVNSALQRARATVRDQREDDVDERADPRVARTTEVYLRAFEAGDVGALVELLTADVVLEMPPVPLWYQGGADYAAFMRRVFAMRAGRWRTVPLPMNSQPAFAAYAPTDDGGHRLHTVQVLGLVGGRISHNTVFAAPEVLARTGLPDRLR